MVGPHQLAHLHRAAGSERAGVDPLALAQEQVELMKNRLLLLAPEPLPVGRQAQERGVAGEASMGGRILWESPAEPGTGSGSMMTP